MAFACNSIDRAANALQNAVRLTSYLFAFTGCIYGVPLTLGRSLRVFFRFFHLLQPEVWSLHKGIFTRRIIDLDFLPFIDKGRRMLSHRFAVHDTIVQRIWLYLSHFVSGKCNRAEE